MLTTLLAVMACLYTHAQPRQYTTTNAKAIKSFESAKAAFNRREYDLALQQLTEALKREPTFVEAHLMQWEVYTEQGKITEARDALLMALEVNSSYFPAAWFFLGALEFTLGRYKEAAPALAKYLSRPTGDPQMREKAEQLQRNCAFALELMANPVPFDPVNLGPGVNTSMPEYYPAMTADGGELLFTRLVNDPAAYKGKNEEFFTSRRIGDVWGPATPLTDINSIYNEGAPTLSADGRTLIFTACELFGEYGLGRTGLGSCDLFISRKEGNRWMPPVNIGPPINTRNWETQPSLSADGRTLYFIRGKSTREGIQNQDILVSKLQEDGSWSSPLPVSPRINTPGKEESVYIHPDGRTLYFASDGHPGMGGMDLYVSRLGSDNHWQTPVNLGYPINTHNDENSLLVGPDGRLALFASNRPDGLGGLDLYSFELPLHARPAGVTHAKGLVTDARTGAPVAATLALYDVQRPNETLLYQSDPVNGTFLLGLPLGHTFALSVRADGYLFHSETFVLEQADRSSPYALHVKLNRAEVGSAVVLKNIFFATDSDVIEPQSEAELLVLADFLKQNPTLAVEIGGHTDNQGSAAYNLSLSDRRAAAVKRWLTDRGGIAAPRIATKGYGAAQPIASNDTDESRAMNRRTEFRITSAGR